MGVPCSLADWWRLATDESDCVYDSVGKPTFVASSRTIMEEIVEHNILNNTLIVDGGIQTPSSFIDITASLTMEMIGNIYIGYPSVSLCLNWPLKNICE